MLTGEAQVIVGSIHFDMLFVHHAEALADRVKEVLTSNFTHFAVGEIDVHTGTIPVTNTGLG
jgi:hypothetical protein